MTNLINFQFLKCALYTVSVSRSTHLSFLLRLKYNKFRIGFLHTSRSHNYLHTELFPVFFWNYQIPFSIYFLKNVWLCAGTLHAMCTCQFGILNISVTLSNTADRCSRWLLWCTSCMPLGLESELCDGLSAIALYTCMYRLLGIKNATVG